MPLLSHFWPPKQGCGAVISPPTLLRGKMVSRCLLCSSEQGSTPLLSIAMAHQRRSRLACLTLCSMNAAGRSNLAHFALSPRHHLHVRLLTSTCTMTTFKNASRLYVRCQHRQDGA